MLMTSCLWGATPNLGRERITLLQPKLGKFTWQKWIKSTGCNPIWQTNWWYDVSVGKLYAGTCFPTTFPLTSRDSI